MLDIKFEYPSVFYLLLLLPILVWFLFYQIKIRMKGLEQFASADVWKWIAPSAHSGARRKRAVLLTLAIFFTIVTFARPKWGRTEEKVAVSALDIIVTLDVSNSMLVEDVVPSRLKKAKHLVRTLMKGIAGDRIGLVAFAGSSHLASPLTTDLGFIEEVLSITGPRSVSSQGTDIGVALKTAREALERGAEDASRVAKESETMPSKVILLISDGEDLEARAMEEVNRLKQDGINLFVFGLGTERGAPIPIRDRNGVLRGRKRDSRGEVVISRFNPNGLERLASAADGIYWSSTEGESEVQELLNRMGTLNRADVVELKLVTYHERYQIPLFIAIFFLFLEVSIPYRRQPQRLKKKAQKKSKKNSDKNSISPVSGTPGAIVTSMFLGFILSLNSTQAWAETDIQTYIENEKGISAFNDAFNEAIEKNATGQMTKEERDNFHRKAKDHFETALSENPDSPELLFNRAVVDLSMGEAESAIVDFSDAAQKAIQQNKLNLAGKAYYNMGTALAKNKKVPQAVDSFARALDAAKVSGDKQLEEDARKQIERYTRLHQMKQQMKRQMAKKKKKEGQKKKEGDEKEQAKEGEEENDEDGEGKKDQAKKDEAEKDSDGKEKSESKRRRRGNTKFKSSNLSKEDADRVMKEIADRAKELQGKMNRQGGKRISGRRDW